VFGNWRKPHTRPTRRRPRRRGGSRQRWQRENEQQCSWLEKALTSIPLDVNILKKKTTQPPRRRRRLADKYVEELRKGGDPELTPLFDLANEIRSACALQCNVLWPRSG